MVDDELVLFSGLDQPIDTDNDWALEQIEKIVAKSVIEHDAHIALDACKQLVSVSKVSGLTLAKGLYLIKQNWNEYGLEDTFEDTAFVHIGLHKYTVDRYIKVWMLFDKKLIPSDLEEPIKQRNIKEIIPIANAVAQGFEITQEQWEDLADATDLSEISRIVREDIKSEAPRKSGIQIYLTRSGEIWAYQNRERFFVGSLEMNDDRETVQKAIERIKRSAGMLEE